MAAPHSRIDATPDDEERSGKKSFEGSEHAENNQAQRGPAVAPPSPVAAAASPPSFSAFLADEMFLGDLSIALALMFTLRSVAQALTGPWVVANRAEAAGTEPVPTCGLPSWAARPAFPCRGNVAAQVLHVARHMVWYTLVRPAHLGDWASAVAMAAMILATGLLLLLGFSHRGGRLWAAWRRWRVATGVTVHLTNRSLMLLASFLLLPPHTWPLHTWGRFVVSSCTQPLAMGLALSLWDQVMFKVPLPATVALAAIDAASIFMLSYTVAPTILCTRQPSWYGMHRVRGGSGQLPVPLQCDGGLRPEHSALLSCRPLAQQVLLGLAMVAWPVALSWAMEGRLRRQHAAMCAEWQRRRQQTLPHSEHLTAVPTPHTSNPPSCASSIRVSDDVHDQDKRTSISCRLTDSALPGFGPPGAQLMAYRALTTTSFLSVKVHEHPGVFQEYAPRLSAVAPQLLMRAAQADTSGTLLQPLGRAASVVVRGCVQLITWGRSLRPEACSRAESDSNGLTEGYSEARAQQDGRPGEEELVSVLCQLLPGVEAGGLGRVCVQVGQHGPAAADCLTACRQRDCGSVRLLLLSPPALCPPLPKTLSGGGARAHKADAGGGAAVVRLQVNSPVRQAGRILVLAEGASAAVEVPSSSSGVSGAPAEQQGLGEQQAQPPARLLCEVAVELVGGPQEVELALGAGELEGTVGADGVGVLQLALVGPEHGAGELGEAGTGAETLQPLVHWMAPPLLLLPDASTAEVCNLWSAICREGVQLHGCADAALVRSSLWWSHMAPLMGDLAYVLGAGQGPDAQRVASHLLPYLYDNCAGELVGLMQRCTGAAARCSRAVQQQHITTTLAATTLMAGSSSHGSATAPNARCHCPSTAAAAPDNATSSSEQAEVRSATGTPELPTSAASLGQLFGRLWVLAGLPILRPLPGPFTPPPLELSYQAWRLAGLAVNARYVLGFCTNVYLILTLRILLSWATAGRGGGVGQGEAAPWARLAHTTAYAVLSSAADILGLAVLYFLVARGRRHVTQQPQQQQQQQQEQSPSTGRHAATDGAPGTTLVLSRADVVIYRLAACVVGPALFLLSSALTVLGVTPLDPGHVGSMRVVYGSSLMRGVVVPCMQQMSAWEMVMATPLLGAAEVLLLPLMQPGWGLWRAAALVCLWRLCAVGVSAAWERSSRRRFMQGQQRLAGEGARGPGEGAGEGAPVRAANGSGGCEWQRLGEEQLKLKVA